MSNEELIIFTEASVRKFLSEANFGVPVTFLQQGDEKNPKVQDEVQILTSINLVPRGTKNEVYGVVNIQALVKTKIVATDVYYHIRVKARVVDVLSRVIPLCRYGGPDTRIYDKTQWGILRKIPSESITVTPTSIDVPDASVVESFFEIHTC